MASTELVEGKDRPQEIGAPEYDDLGGKTVDLLLHLLKDYFGLVCYFVWDSGVCFLKAIF